MSRAAHDAWAAIRSSAGARLGRSLRAVRSDLGRILSPTTMMRHHPRLLCGLGFLGGFLLVRLLLAPPQAARRAGLGQGFWSGVLRSLAASAWRAAKSRLL